MSTALKINNRCSQKFQKKEEKSLSCRVFPDFTLTTIRYLQLEILNIII